MTTLIAFGLRLALLAALTFGFVVLFEYGPANYAENAKKEWTAFLAFTRGLSAESEPAPTPQPTPESTPAPVPVPEPTPEPTAAPNGAPSAWEALQNRPIGDGMNQPINGTPAP